MAKATKPGNIAVSGIKETVTNEPTVKQDGTTASQAKKEEAAANKAVASTTKTSPVNILRIPSHHFKKQMEYGELKKI